MLASGNGPNNSAGFMPKQAHDDEIDVGAQRSPTSGSKDTGRHPDAATRLHAYVLEEASPKCWGMWIACFVFPMLGDDYCPAASLTV